ncbi:metallophosphatase family protein [bacterium]|nr:metallophosphatase family protein [bacterium]MBU1073775.1 metallophosphatase family protein [bacterium]MBU1677024.1 metallophosphatase family protein [bacterium]
MRYAVLGDIHANLEALHAVMAHIDGQEVDACLCTGDVVGYGADPAACLELVRDAGMRTVQGNHDAMAATDDRPRDFNAWAEDAVLWTRRQLVPEQRLWLGELPLMARPEPDLLMTHGSPAEPERWHYLELVILAREAFASVDDRVCLLGHTHRPWSYRMRGARVVGHHMGRIELDPAARYLVNPGSVGQPRDRNPQAAYAVYDTGTRLIDLHRVVYDVERAMAKIRDAGLPGYLASRLSGGR